MIAEVIPGAYDALGTKVFDPFHRRKAPHPSFPMGRYVSHPLTVKCDSIADIRRFLMGCKGVSDEELFGKRDYWQPPEDFEQLKKGDCEDFALWTWRQLLSLGYDARFVGGKAGRYGVGHAWVTYFQDGKCFLVEPMLRSVGETFPRLSTIKYKPQYSVAWDGQSLSYYAHQDRPIHLRFWSKTLPLVAEWAIFWTWVWLLLLLRLYRLPLFLFRKLMR
jgi:Bacterial transglutaminase-like cysteine proteinase BTLCP